MQGAVTGTVDRHLDHPDAAVLGQCLPQRREICDALVRRAGRGAERGQVDVVRCAEDALERPGELGRALLQHREYAAAVVIDHDDREVGARLVGPDHESGRVVQEGQVPDERVRRPGMRAVVLEGGADRGRHGAVDARQASVGEDRHRAVDGSSRHVDVAYGVGRAEHARVSLRGPRRRLHGRPRSRWESGSPASTSSTDDLRRAPGVEPLLLELRDADRLLVGGNPQLGGVEDPSRHYPGV